MKKEMSTSIRVSSETKELIDKAKDYPEETHDRVIKRLLDSSISDTPINIDGRTPLEHKAYKQMMQRRKKLEEEKMYKRQLKDKGVKE